MSNTIFNLNPVLPEGYTLEEAAIHGHFEGVKCLMEKGSRIPGRHIPHDYGWAIVGAACNGHLEILKYLIEFKDQSFPEEKYKEIPVAKLLQKMGPWCAEMAIKDAIENGHCEVVKYLLQQRLAKYSKTLGRATRAENVNMVRGLVEQIADLTRIKKGAFDEAAYEAVLRGNFEILKYLVEQGANTNAIYGKGLYSQNENALAAACRLNKLEIVKFLVEQGEDIHTQCKQALCNAVLSGNLDMVKFLLDQGADIHAQNDQALYDAVFSGNLDMVEFLVEQGANIHAQEERTLICACRLGHLEIVEYLVAQGADIHAQNEQALKEVCRKGSLLLVKFLVKQETRSILRK